MSVALIKLGPQRQIWFAKVQSGDRNDFWDKVDYVVRTLFGCWAEIDLVTTPRTDEPLNVWGTYHSSKDWAGIFEVAMRDGLVE